MKTVVMLALVMMLVAGIAVNGSRAQALTATSVAFEQCWGKDAAQTDRCQPLVRSLLAQTDFEGADRQASEAAGAGGDVGDNAEIGESRGWIAAVALAWEVAKYFLDNRYFPGSVDPRRPAIVIEAIFDPSR